MKIKFREIKIEDSKLILNWIKTNQFVKEWYYSNTTPRLKTIENKLNNKINNANMIVKIAMLNGKDFGYIQCYPVDGQGAWSTKVKVYNKTCSIDYYIGDINYIHMGYGKEMILSFIEQVVKPLKYEYAMISPDPKNNASVRCCQKCGFCYYKTVNVPYKNSKEIEAVYIKKLKIE